MKATQINLQEPVTSVAAVRRSRVRPRSGTLVAAMIRGRADPRARSVYDSSSPTSLGRMTPRHRDRGAVRVSPRRSSGEGDVGAASRLSVTGDLAGILLCSPCLRGALVYVVPSLEGAL